MPLRLLPELYARADGEFPGQNAVLAPLDSTPPDLKALLKKSGVWEHHWPEGLLRRKEWVAKYLDMHRASLPSLSATSSPKGDLGQPQT